MSRKTCADCIHCQMCRWIDDMVKNSTCDFFKDWKELEKRPRGEWITCSERLPSYSERIVLATVVRRDKTWNNDPYHRLVTYINGKWYPVPQSINLVPSHMATIEQSDGGQAEVIAWMPLPEPYKGEGEEK